MNSKIVLCFLLGKTLLPAAIPVSGASIYSQNFDTLPSAAGMNWTDDDTIPGWWLHRSGPAPPNPASIQVSNGGPSAWVAALYSFGATSSSERSLGSASTTVHGTYSFIVIFQNSSASPLKVGNIKYDVEVFRTNTLVGQAETTGFSSRIESTQAAITSSPGTGWTNDSSLDHIYPGQAIGGQARPPDVATVNRTPGTKIIVPAGEFLALRWFNPNDAGGDAYMGIDNVSVSFTAPQCILSASASNIARQLNGTPFDPTDDTFSFTVLVTGFGTSPTGWNSPSWAGTSGSYGTATTITGVPVSASPLTFTVVDATHPDCTDSLVVTTPVGELLPDVLISFTAPPNGAQSYVRTANSPEAGWSGGTVVAAVRNQPAPNNNAKYFDINGSKPTFVTEAVNISATAAFRVGIDLAAYTTATSGFEPGDALTVNVETAASAAGPWTVVAVLLDGAVTDGVELFEQVRVSDPGTNYGAGNYPDWDFFFVTKRTGAIPRGGANYARLVTTGGNDALSEHLLLDNITFYTTALDAWRHTHFGTTDDTGDAANHSDPDMDSVDNLLEFAFGLNPHKASFDALPAWRLEDDDYVFSFTQPSGVSGVIYIAEASTTLAPGSWTPLPNSGVPPLHTFYAPADMENRLYLRLHVFVP